MQWQPIDTAPRDGTSILVYCTHGQYVVAWPDPFYSAVEFWEVTDNKHGPWVLRGQSPTHWMPLPQPPTE